MKIRSTSLLFAFVLLLPCLGLRAAAAGDGLYATAESGPVVRTIDGKEIHLGERLADRGVRATWVRSESNSNDRFSIQIEKDGPFSRPNDQIVLCVKDYCVTFPGSGTNSYTKYTIDAWGFPSQAAAEAFAEYFATTLKLRSHPGHMLVTRFIPGKDSFSIDEALPVTLEIKNVGTSPVSFRVGGKNRGTRDNQFGFTAYLGNAVPDTGNSNHLGGLSGQNLLQPGQTFTKDVDLREWFKFKTPGTYHITGTYELLFSVPQSTEFFTLWHDYAAAEFQISIK